MNNLVSIPSIGAMGFLLLLCFSSVGATCLVSIPSIGAATKCRIQKAEGGKRFYTQIHHSEFSIHPFRHPLSPARSSRGNRGNVILTNFVQIWYVLYLTSFNPLNRGNVILTSWQDGQSGICPNVFQSPQSGQGQAISFQQLALSAEYTSVTGCETSRDISQKLNADS